MVWRESGRHKVQLSLPSSIGIDISSKITLRRTNDEKSQVEEGGEDVLEMAVRFK